LTMGDCLIIFMINQLDTAQRVALCKGMGGSTMRSTISRTLLIAAIATVMAGCGEDVTANGDVAGSIDGFVYVTATVTGATVKAYIYDATTGHLTGYPEHPFATAAPTTPDGRFHLEFGATHVRM